MAGIGHNRGPTLEPGGGWRRHAWARARAELLPTLPVEIVRRRVRRAAELGLDYRSYAGIRASTGRDVIGFLFSSNALRLVRASDALPEDRARRLGALRGCDRTALVHAPVDPARLIALACLDAAHEAPRFDESWSQMRARVAAILRMRGLPPDGVVLVGETGFERDWSEAGRMAGYLPGERYFGTGA